MLNLKCFLYQITNSDSQIFIFKQTTFASYMLTVSMYSHVLIFHYVVLHKDMWNMKHFETYL